MTMDEVQKIYTSNSSPSSKHLNMKWLVCVAKSTMWPVGTFPDKHIASWMGTFSRYCQLHGRSCADRLCLDFVQLFFSLFCTCRGSKFQYVFLLVHILCKV
jgi:hypothetical protein